MNLSDKLAALEEQERSAAKRVSNPVVETARRRARGPEVDNSKRNASSSWAASKRKVRELVLTEVAPKVSGLTAEGLNTEVKAALDRILQREDVKVSPRERRAFLQEMIQDTLGYGPLDPFLADVDVTEIMCNAYDDIWVERSGRLHHTGVSFTDDNQYRHVIEKIVAAVGRRVDESSPMVDARLPDGSRVNAVIPPLAIHGPVLTIRKFAADPYQVKDLINFGTFTLDLATVMEACVRGKLSILVSGGTGTGKTTNLNVLSSFIPDGERIVTIEDAAELQLQQPHIVSLEARPANAEGAGEVRIRDLVRNALRMRPDRIIVGEVRGPEALDMLQAMNTGHEGSMTTVHCNSPRDGLSRLETMVLMSGYDLPVRAIREQICSAINLIMHLDRLPNGRRVVTSVTELQGMEGDTILLQDIFKFKLHPRRVGSPGPGDAEGTANGEADEIASRYNGELAPTGLRPKFLDKLAEEGIDVPAKVFRVNGPPQPPRSQSRSGSRRKMPAMSALAEPERAR
ncbi:MAG TPA: CpaF family protein [Acidimicrobiales bacterium]|nr:CpaF family protein [Acidimicrobiales bacterium]